jgi:hypothetical protein
LLVDGIPSGDGDEITDIPGLNFNHLDLAKPPAGDSGFKNVVFGALLAFTQTWYAQGVTLVQLLHSTSLAPTKSPRIAVIDWSQKIRAGQTGVISEVDDLTTHTRLTTARSAR